MSKIACVLPTRGLIYARTIRGVLRNLVGSSGDLIIIDGLPMPDCFNNGIEQAIDSGADYIWMVEEDNGCPDQVLNKMLKEDKDIITIEYGVAGGASHVQRDAGGELIWCGIGCTLIKREVFESVPKPWFRVDMKRDHATGEWSKWPDHQIPKKFGGHDVWFFTQARQLGFKIDILADVKGSHFRAKELPKREMNHGTYTIYSL